MSEETFVRLIELVSLSKKALEAGQNECSQANQILGDSKALADSIHSLHPKLSFLAGQIHAQIQIISTLAERLNKRRQLQQHSFQVAQNEFDGINHQLNGIFDLLKRRQVDEEFNRDSKLASVVGKAKSPLAPLSSSSSSSASIASSPATAASASHHLPQNESLNLFDFVDIDSIDHLRDQTLQEMRKMEEVIKKGTKICSLLESKAQDFRTALVRAQLAFNLEVSEIEKTIEITTAENSITDSMADSLIMVTNHYEGIVNLLKKVQSSRDRPRVDIPGLEAQTRASLLQASELRNPLERLRTIHEGLRKKKDLAFQVNEDLLSLFAQVDEYGPQLTKSFSELKTFDQQFETSRGLVDGNLTEFASLLAWYQQFYRAYNHLILEIGRRYSHLEAEQSLIQNFLKSLEENWKIEAEKRMEFWELFGQYLPGALCPSIKEPVSRRQIFPEHYLTKLPRLSEASILKAKKTLHSESFTNE